MPEPARRVLACGIVAVLGLLLALFGAVAPPAGAQPETAGSPYASMSLTTIAPTLVTATSPRTVTVSGQLTNTFDRPIRDVVVRLQRGDALTDDAALRTSLAAETSAFGVVTPFAPVADELAAGATARFTITVPVSGDSGLAISDTGVYPLLVNANGTPDYGGPSRIADSRVLLPVLSLPADPARAAGYDPGFSDPQLQADGAVHAPTSSPAAFTMLIPFAAPPQLAPGVLGGGTEELRLTSDSMANSLAPNGRLHSLLEEVTALATSGDERVRSAVCLAVDPDLLITVRGMADGYGISSNPADPQSSTHPGPGSTEAGEWFELLKSIAPDLCVVALPFAQAGLQSLVNVGNNDFSASALTGAADLVDALLGVESVRGFTVPGAETLSTGTAALLTGLGIPGAATASTAVRPGPAPRTTADVHGRYRLGEIAVQTYSPAVTAALGTMGTGPGIPAITPVDDQPDFEQESALARRQSGIAALAFPMLTPRGDAAPDSGDGEPGERSPLPVTGRSAFVVPPAHWSATAADLHDLLGTARVLIDAGTAVPVPLADVVAELPAAGTPATAVVPPGVDAKLAAGFPTTAEQTDAIRSRLDTSWQLQSALVGGRETVTTPQRLMAPLREDLLRAIVTPPTPDTDSMESARDMRLSGMAATLAQMQASVRLLDPSGRYTLASERSPLLLVVRNDLALPIRVRLHVDAPPSLQVEDLGAIEIPARGTRQLQVPTLASTSEPTEVKISLVTSTALPLSDAITLSVYSNAYGKPLFYLTITAAVILVLLTARRLWHRFRGQPDPADADRPEPDERDRLLAGSTYQHRERHE